MPQTTLHFPAPLPNKHDLLKAIQEESIEAKFSSENSIDIIYGKTTSTLNLGEQEIIVHTEQEAMTSKPLLLKISMGLVGAVSLFFTMGIKYRTALGLEPVLILLLGSFIIVGFVVPAKSAPNKHEFHSIIINYLKDTYEGEEIGDNGKNK